MKKFNIKKQGTSTYLTTKLKRGQELNTREVEILSRQIYEQLLPVKIERKKLIYNISALTTLEEVIVNNISVDEFFALIEKIVELLKTIQSAYLYDKNIIIDPKYIYFVPQNGGLAVIYIPILNYDNIADIKTFLMKLVNKAHIQPEQDTVRITQFSSFLEQMTFFSLYQLENFIQNVSNIKNIIPSDKSITSNSMSTLDYNTKTCQECDCINTVDARFCFHCGTSFDHDGSKPVEPSYVPEFEDDESKTKLKRNSEKTSGTTVLGTGNYSGTTVLSPEELGRPVYPFLIRVRTGEKVYVDKPVFRIGKEKSYVDYFISDNGAISRSHADIIGRDGKYFIKDQNSTNGTYVNEKVIPADIEYQIQPGQKLKLANEEFDFGLDE